MRSIVFLYSIGYFVKMGGLLYTSYQQVTALLIFFDVIINVCFKHNYYMYLRIMSDLTDILYVFAYNKHKQ